MSAQYLDHKTGKEMRSGALFKFPGAMEKLSNCVGYNQAQLVKKSSLYPHKPTLPGSHCSMQLSHPSKSIKVETSSPD